MRIFTAKVRKWGNSLGVVIPKNVIEEERIGEDDNIEVNILKANPSRIWELAGTLNTDKSTDDIMREIDEGYD